MPLKYNRERTATDYRVVDNSYRWEGDGYALHTFPTALKTFSFVNIFKDVIKKERPFTNKNGIRIKSISPCYHLEIVYDGKNQQPFLGDHALHILPENQPPWMDSGYLDGWIPELSSTVWSQLAEEAFNDFSTRFPESVSFSEFLLGLGKLHELFPKLSGDVIKDLASIQLSKSFGWDNLLSDLKNLGTLFSDVKARIEYLKQTRGKPVRLGFYRKNVLLDDLPIGTEFGWSPVRGFGTKVVLEGYSDEFRAGATLVQSLPHLDDTLGLMRGIMSSLGLNNPLKVIWVNLRMSFVLDWFTQVSRHLDRLARLENVEDRWETFNVSSSFKQHARFGVYQVNTDIDGPVNPVIRLGTVTLDRYVREVGLPIGWEVYTPNNLNPSQLKLLFAMMA